MAFRPCGNVDAKLERIGWSAHDLYGDKKTKDIDS